MDATWADVLDKLRSKTGAPVLNAADHPRAYQVLFGPTFSRPFAVTVSDFGDYADVTLHAQAVELVQWEDGTHGPKRRDGHFWRESKTVTGEPLDAFRRGMQAIAIHKMSDRHDAGRDGILLELTACIDGRTWTISAVSPRFDTAPNRFVRNVLNLARVALKFDESRALLRLDGYGIDAP